MSDHRGSGWEWLTIDNKATSKEELRSLRPAEQEFEEDIRQRVDPPLAHVPIDLIPRPAAGVVKERCVLPGFVHWISPYVPRFCRSSSPPPSDLNAIIAKVRRRKGGRVQGTRAVCRMAPGAPSRGAMRIIVKSSSGLVRSFLPPVGDSSMLSFISNPQAKNNARALCPGARISRIPMIS